jgi:predicted secreted protein
LSAGETFRCALRGAGAAGYDWRWTIDGDASAIVVAVEPAAPSPASPRVGSVGLTLSIRAAHAGVAQLNLVLARPARSPAPPIESFGVAVTVS